jgi:hypothetical protein
VNGGAFAPISGMFSGKGCDGRIVFGTSNPLANTPAFCGSFFNSEQSTRVDRTTTVGTTFRFAFYGGWDAQGQEANPNWRVSGLLLRNLAPAVVVPEPSTYALLATGLLALGMVARRRRAS